MSDLETKAESNAVSARRGKWSVPGIPHSGWTCVAVTDLGEVGPICEMCETQAIRYVHTMENPRHPLKYQGFTIG
jgi:hypothetical protein